jgi:DNA-binding response OmpR family regulator/anti-sigma regulatory factor (Ser/Thr protein kinase)
MHMTENEQPLILIVDDTYPNLKVLGSILRDNGYQVAAASSGSRALAAAEAEPPDLVLLDIQMPEMDGFEVCRRLKEMPGTADIPIVFLTAFDSVEYISRGFEMGAEDYVTKPFKAGELLARLNTHLSLRKSQQELQRINLQMQQMNHVLEEKVKERTVQLSNSLEKEKRFNEFQTRIMGMIAHEFRTPLTVIMSNTGMVQRILQKQYQEKEAKADLLLDGVIGQVKQITHMLSSVEKLMEMHSMLINPTRVSTEIGAFVEKVAKRYVHAFLPVRTLEVSIQQPDYCFQLPVHPIETILQELLSNAIKFSPTTTSILIDIAAQPQGHCSIAVRDFGKGILPEDQKVLYELFRRGSEETEIGRVRGLGIGLALVKMCVDSLGGQIIYRHMPDGGSCFIVEFTLKPEESADTL